MSDTVVLRGATLIDGTDREPIAHAVLAVRGETIVATGEGEIPEGARILDCSGKTIMPGLVSNHAHVGLVDGADVGPGHYTRPNILRQLAQYEAYGVTTVTSLGLNGALFCELRDEMHAGKHPGADLFGVDRGVGVPNGAPPEAMFPLGNDQLFRPRTPAEARAAVREMADRRTDFVKLWLDDFAGALPVKMSPAIYEAVIDEAHARGVRVAAHIHDLEDARAVARAGVDLIAHGVRDAPVDEAFVRLLEANGTWYVPTLALDESTFAYAERPVWTADLFTQHALQPALRARFDDPAWRARTLHEPKSAAARASLATNLRNLKTLHDAGISIGFGADSGGTPLRVPGVSEHRELALMVEAGLTPLQAIRMATRHAAALLQLGDRGVLAPGKRADFIVLDADPSHTIANTKAISAVWHRGRPVRGPIETFVP
ncbi:amidohydrolase family protein [Pendulispora rubella]|uniref:Amidohydrolase family protein n=1 Tax=Pendulispora rubella TaxID=2741070 RepID=A0ABZ2LIU3_9BACT